MNFPSIRTGKRVDADRVLRAAQQEQQSRPGPDVTSLCVLPGVVLYQRVVTPEGHIRYSYISEGARDLFGVSPEEIVSDPNALFSCHSAEYSAMFRERLLAASRSLSAWDVEASIISRDGRKKYTHAIARPERKPDGSVLWTGIIFDETRTRTAVIESLSQAFLLYDFEDRLILRNSHYLQLHPSLMGVAVPGAKYNDVVRSELACSLNVPIEAVDQTLEYRNCIERHRQPHSVFECQLNHDCWILVNEHRTDDGGTVVLYTDISELKRSEKERLSVLGQLTATVAHELRNPLSAIRNTLGVLREMMAGADIKADRPLSRIERSIERCDKIISNLLDYARHHDLSCSPNQLDRWCGEVLDEQATIISSIKVERQLAAPDAVVNLDTDRFRRVIINLLENALQAMQQPQDNERKIIIQTRAADRAEIIIKDTGTGIAPDVLPKIFEPLFSTKSFGTGLGLPIVKQIVEDHGGTIAIESELGLGTTVRIDLPLSKKPRTAA
jgi:nitrogen-specific signal transduction histidine kinase